MQQGRYSSRGCAQAQLMAPAPLGRGELLRTASNSIVLRARFICPSEVAWLPWLERSAMATPAPTPYRSALTPPGHLQRPSRKPTTPIPIARPPKLGAQRLTGEE